MAPASVWIFTVCSSIVFHYIGTLHGPGSDHGVCRHTETVAYWWMFESSIQWSYPWTDLSRVAAPFVWQLQRSS
jgi:hypothetical protein